jgi:hypothetical protein
MTPSTSALAASMSLSVDGGIQSNNDAIAILVSAMTDDCVCVLYCNTFPVTVAEIVVVVVTAVTAV